MRCPVDKSDMIVVEHKKIELDYCLQCAGVWFDSGELDLLVSTIKATGADISHTELLKPQEARVDEAKRKCPICGRKMNKVWIGNAPKVLIDSCPIGHGLWFDGGELGQVLQAIEPANISAANSVVNFLGDAFKVRTKSPPDKS